MHKDLQKRIQIVALALQKISAPVNKKGLTWSKWADAAGMPGALPQATGEYASWKNGDDPEDYRNFMNKIRGK